jgi:hypothetical protein
VTNTLWFDTEEVTESKGVSVHREAEFSTGVIWNDNGHNRVLKGQACIDRYK